jgi:hypothetical protein
VGRWTDVDTGFKISFRSLSSGDIMYMMTIVSIDEFLLEIATTDLKCFHHKNEKYVK